MKNILVFILSTALIILGLLSGSLRDGLKNNIFVFRSDAEETDVFDAFSNLTDNTEDAVTSNLSYHDRAVDLYSLCSRFFGTRVVEKDDITVVRADNGYLGSIRSEASDNSLTSYADNVESLCRTANASGAEFLYVMAPIKGYGFSYPPNVTDYTASNCDRFAEMLRQRDIPFLSLIESAASDGISDEDMFFVTDHHWKPNRGLWASKKIADTLGFEYDKTILDTENYKTETYKNWFLGSQGKKVGTYFTKFGADDFDIITPKFETNLTETQPFKSSVRSGDFTQTVLYPENSAVRDYYRLNPYATYSGGDFREQIITNNLNPDGKKILIVRDSYACALVPFLSLTMSETYAVDIRENDGYVGDKLKISELIEEIQPDYVMVFYSGLTDLAALYDFE